jgi:hypothetical protein
MGAPNSDHLLSQSAAVQKKGSSATSRQAAGIDLLERKFSQRAVDPSFRRLPAAAPTTGSESSLRPRSTRSARRRTRRQGRVYRSRKRGFLQNFIACLRVSTTRCTCPQTVRPVAREDAEGAARVSGSAIPVASALPPCRRFGLPTWTDLGTRPGG